MADIRNISCPCCGRTLFRQELQQRNGVGDAVWLNTPDRPPVEKDDQGHFMKCPQCSKRVAMLPDPKLPGSGFLLSPVQKCDQTLP